MGNAAAERGEREHADGGDERGNKYVFSHGLVLCSFEKTLKRPEKCIRISLGVWIALPLELCGHRVSQSIDF